MGKIYVTVEKQGVDFLTLEKYPYSVNYTFPNEETMLNELPELKEAKWDNRSLDRHLYTYVNGCFYHRWDEKDLEGD